MMVQALEGEERDEEEEEEYCKIESCGLLYEVEG